MRYILKYILSLVFFITLFNSSVFAQGGYISLYQAGLNITLQDGKIPYKNDNKTTDVTGFVTFTKNIPDSLECNVSAIFVHRSTTGTETTISDSIRVSDSEFRTSISVPKNFTFKLQPNKKAGQVILRFKYYKKNYPNTTNGWSSMESGKTWQTVEIDTVPPASFNGPSQICDEGTYTITNPGTITLENAAGVATLTALGNNQWKVTKTNSLGGVVVLKSQLGTTSFTKSIKIDPSYLDGIINGPVMIKQTDADLNFVFEPSNNEVDFTDLIWSTNNPYVKLNKVNETTATLTFLPGFNIPSGQTNLNLEVTASKSNSCGIISATSIIKVRK